MILIMVCILSILFEAITIMNSIYVLSILGLQGLLCHAKRPLDKPEGKIKSKSHNVIIIMVTQS